MKHWVSLVNVPEVDQYIDLARHAEDLAKIMVRRRKLERAAAETNIDRAQVSLDRATRKANVRGTAQLTTGETVTVETTIG